MKRDDLKGKFEKKFTSLQDHLSVSEASNRDHYMYNIFYKGKKVGIFQISRSSKEFGPGLIGLMSRQLKISSSDLKGIVSCTFWGRDFIEKSGLISEDNF